MKARNSSISIIRRLASVAFLAALLAPASPALGEGALHELGEIRLQQIRERIESLSQEEIAKMRADKLRSELRASAQKQLGEFTCLPTCDEDDAKFLAIAGTGLVTLSDPVLDVTVSAPSDATTFSVGIFDGDGGVADPTSIDNGPFFLSRWDLTGSLTTSPRDVDYEYRLFASPPGGPEVEIDLFLAADGDVFDPDCSAPGANCAFPSALMPNDGWKDFSIVTGPEAQTPSGSFLYRLEISQDTTDPDLDNHVNVFKVRTSAVVTLRLGNQPFSYISTVNVSEDFFDVFPLDGGFFNALPTSYDGAWQFFFDLSAGQDKLILWDGDFDRGDSSVYGFTNQDSDDPDTPGSPFLPTELFDITVDACSEAAAQNNPSETCGTGGAPSGSPADNIALLPPFDPSNTVFLTLAELAVRMPTVEGDLIFPDGRLFANSDPSGNQEWEQFLISTEANCDATPTCVPTDGNPIGLDPSDAVGQPCADVCLPPAPGQVPAGIYEARIKGVDMFNLNALRLPQLLCVDEAGTPCSPPRDFLLGDTVFLDLDGDGTDNGGADPGISGVTVELVGEDGEVIAVTATDINGNYQFPVDAGTFTVRVAAQNFVLPPAAGGAVGDRVWLDVDGNGDDNGGTEPGLSNIKIVLFEEVGGVDIVVDSTVTDTNGNYFFRDLPPGTYFTDVADATVPAGLTLSGGTDPSASVVITSNEVFDTLDFGYEHVPTAGTATVGDLVWLDADNDGTLDAGEMGLGGVTVALTDTTLVDVLGNPLVLATTLTADNGLYLFTDVLPGTYQVEVTDNNGVLTGLSLTVGPDSNPNPTVGFSVVAGDVILDKDFGYFAAGLNSIGDTVWFDANRNGLLDGAETGIGGVTVNLLGPLGGVRATTTTAPDGTFSFNNLPDGDYSLLLTNNGGALDGLLPTTKASASSSQNVELAGVDVVGVNFGWVDTPALLGLVGTTIKSPNANVDEQTDTLVDDNNLDYDFGYIAAGSLGDRVWFDIDGDGVQDAGEPGIPGVTVELLDPDTGITRTTTTGPDGIYLFDGLRPNDDYVVTVDDSTLPAGLNAPTYDLDDPVQPIGTPHTTVVSLGVASPGVADDRDDVDFGYQGTGSIGDRVWSDVNPDGVQGDPLVEPGINGVTVELLDSTGTVIATQVTSGDGNYLFENLPPGDYTVRVVPPAALIQTFDLDLVLDNETAVTLLLDENRTDVDFGYRPGLGSLGDRVWLDADGNGLQDGGEVGINGVEITLLNSGGISVATATTSGDGNYTFGDLEAGTYTVVVDAGTLPADLAQTFDLDGLATANGATTSLAAGEDRVDVDFGYGACGPCAGKITRLTLQYLGSTVDAQVEVFAKKGPNTESVFDGILQPGDSFDVIGLATGNPGFAGTLGTEVRIFVDGSLHTMIHTSCSVPVGPGLVSGDFKVLAGASKNGGLLCPIGDPGDGSICLDEIDFETDGEGGNLVAGQIIDDEWASLGVQVTTNNPSDHPAMIFDSSNPTGGDRDLGTPNEGFGGPGVGTGGGPGQPGANAVPLGNVLILSEDGDSGDPDDNASGGTLIFTFDVDVRVDAVQILDIDEGMAGSVTAFDEDGMTVGSAGMANNLGNNSVQKVALGATGVRRLEVHFPGSGAVAGIVFCAPGGGNCDSATVRDDFETSSFENNDGPDNWATGWIENDPEAGGAGPLAGQVQIHDGLLSLDDYPNTGGRPTAAREVDLTGATHATLRFDFLTSSGVDHDDAVKVQVSPDGGATWKTLEVITNISGYHAGSRSFDISAFATEETRVRFRVTKKYGGYNEVFCLTFVEIESDCDTCSGTEALDDFESSSFTNNDGASDWADGWIENDPQSGGSGPSTGQVQIHDGFLTLDDYPNTGGHPSVAREVDLSGAESATLEFDFYTSYGVDYSDAVTVEISSDGGATWTTLEVITNISGAIEGDRSYDISAFASSETRVRFRVSNKYGGSNEIFCLGFVKITSTCGGGV